jgi:predicted amidohydrolase
MDDLVTYQTYRDKMFAMADTAVPNRASLVQAGVDDVASHIRPADPLAPERALVNFPEDVGLLAAFIGSRGLQARSSVNSQEAFLSLYARYAVPRAYYRKLYSLDPSLIVPLIVMSVTDTTYRAFYETFRDLAVTYQVYVTAGANVPPVRVVYQADDPELYDTLIDPDEKPFRNYVYFATSPHVVNTTFVFLPDGEVFIQNDDGTVTSAPSGTDGEIRGSQDKIYLTPIELQLLRLKDAPIDTLRVLNTPVGRLGIVISKDAWMPDINDRLAARHAHMLIQSEAFSSWGYQAAPWDPDIFQQGGFNNLQQHETFQINVAPSMTGNLLEITFDGQSSIVGRQTSDDPGALSSTNAWIGQNPRGGMLAVAPWIMDDPGIADAGATLAARRSALAAQGAKLLPGSDVVCPGPLAFGACENGYREAVVWTDVDLPSGVDVLRLADPAPPAPTAWGSSVQVNADDDLSPSSQLSPRIAADGDSVYAVWQDTRNGADNVYAAFSLDAGQSWSGDIKVSDDAPGARVELLPDVALFRDPRHGVATIYVVWQRLGSGGNHANAEIRLARFDEILTKLAADVRVDDHDGSGKWRPRVVALAPAGRPLVSWVDERDPGPGISVLEHVRVRRASGRRDKDGRPEVSFSRASRRVTRDKTVDPLSAQLENEWAPALATDDRRVIAAWLDFRNYNWDVFAAFSRRGGLSYKRDVRLDDSPDFERLNSHPAIAIDSASGRAVVVWSDQREREVDTNIFYVTSTDGIVWSAPTRLDHSDAGFDPDSEAPSSQWRPSVSSADGRACVAWQDNRLRANHIFAALSSDAGTSFGGDERVDDSGAGSSEQFSPAVVAVSGACYVAWSDDRSGDFDIRVARRSF